MEKKLEQKLFDKPKYKFIAQLDRRKRKESVRRFGKMETVSTTKDEFRMSYNIKYDKEKLEISSLKNCQDMS